MNEYSPGDIHTDEDGNRWLKLACGRWALIFDDIKEPDEPIQVDYKGRVH